MIKYNNNTINDFNFGTSNIIKVYRNNAVCYYKIASGSSGQTPCFAVVDDILSYSDTEFEDVFNKADGKWYKLNNLNEYEEYGVYGSGRTITYYDGKLTIDEEEAPRQFHTLQELADTYSTSYSNHNYTFDDTSNVSGITYFRFYPSRGTSQASYVYTDLNADNATGTTKFAIKADANGSLWASVGGYSSLKAAADSSSCTWAYWVDGDTIEVDVVSAVGTTIFIKQWQDNFVTDIISYQFGTTPTITYEYQYSGDTWVNVGEVSVNVKTSGFTIQDIGEKINTAITDGDYCVISYYNHDIPTEPQYMVSYKNQSGHNYLNNFSGNTGSNTITQNTIIDAAVWKFEAVPNSADTWYIRNIYTNEYFGYQSRSSNNSLYLVSDTSKIGVRVVNTYQNAAGFVETASNTSSYNGYGYAINQLNGYTYRLNWWNTGSTESSYWGSDGNASFTIYKLAGGSTIVYPVYYSEMQDPPNNLSFSSMTEAEQYECPWVGMTVSINGSAYTFTSGYTWEYVESRLPVGYTEVQYIQNYVSSSDSYTTLSYIDTNYIPTENTRTVADLKIDRATNNPRLFGSGRWDSLGYMIDGERTIGSSNSYFYYKFGNTNTWYTTSVRTDLQRHVFDFNNNGKFIIDNNEVSTLPSTSFTCTMAMGIFTGIRAVGDEVDLNESMYGKMYSFKIYDNGTLVRDFVPCKNPNNVVGAYDLVNGVFYQSANNNSFIAGPSSNTNSEFGEPDWEEDL